MNDFGRPGIGGSLGECALCGKNFLFEILTHGTTGTFIIEGCNQTLHAHLDCIKQWCGKAGEPIDPSKLPSGSPLRAAIERKFPEQTKTTANNK